jgi:hypothetical protein
LISRIHRDPALQEFSKYSDDLNLPCMATVTQDYKLLIVNGFPLFDLDESTDMADAVWVQPGIVPSYTLFYNVDNQCVPTKSQRYSS